MPSISEFERLFLLEFFVDSIYIKNSSVEEVNDSTLCVSFQFLNYPVMLVCEEDFAPKTKPLSKGTNVVFKSGKSCLFSLRSDQGNSMPEDFDLTIKIIQNMTKSNPPARSIVAEAKVGLGNSFTNLMKTSRTSSSPAACVKQDTFPLLDNTGQQVGNLAAFVRLSCFGKLIVTQFQLAGDENKNYMFKGTDPKKIFTDDNEVIRPISSSEKHEDGTTEEHIPGDTPFEDVFGYPKGSDESIKTKEKGEGEGDTEGVEEDKPIHDQVIQDEKGEKQESVIGEKQEDYKEIGAEINGNCITIRVLKKGKKKKPFAKSAEEVSQVPLTPQIPPPIVCTCRCPPPAPITCPQGCPPMCCPPQAAHPPMCCPPPQCPPGCCPPPECPPGCCPPPECPPGCCPPPECPPGCCPPPTCPQGCPPMCCPPQASSCPQGCQPVCCPPPAPPPTCPTGCYSSPPVCPPGCSPCPPQGAQQMMGYPLIQNANMPQCQKEDCPLGLYNPNPQQNLMDLEPGTVAMKGDQVIFQMSNRPVGEPITDREKKLANSVYYKVAATEAGKEGMKNTVHISPQNPGEPFGACNGGGGGPVSGLPVDNKQDMFLLKLQQNSDGVDAKSKLEMELRTPKTKELKPDTSTKNTQYVPTDFPAPEKKPSPEKGKKKKK